MFKIYLLQAKQFLVRGQEKLSRKQFIFLSSILIGIISAFAVIFLKAFAHSVYSFATSINAVLKLSFINSIFPIIGILLIVFVVKKVQFTASNVRMKKIQSISAILVFLLSFISRAECIKHCYCLENFKSHNNFITTSGIQLNSASASPHTKDHEVHFKVKKKIKNRAIVSESITFKTPYLIKLVDFKIFKNRLIYGIPSVYQIQRYTYLHLYQLF